MIPDSGARLVLGALIITVIGAFVVGVGSGFIWGMAL